MPDSMKNVLLAVLAVVVLSGAVFAVKSGGASGATEAPRQARPSPTTAPPKVLWLGDSFPEGTGASSPQSSFVGQVCAAKGWDCINLAQGATGYYANKAVATFRGRLPVSALVPQAIRAEANIVVVAAGLNDSDQPPDKVAAAIAATYSGIRKGLPNAKIIAVGPFWPDGFPVPSIFTIRDEVKAAAISVGGVFIDPVGEHWVTGHRAGDTTPGTETAATLTGPDHTHPTQAGHDNMARRLLADLQRQHV